MDARSRPTRANILDAMHWLVKGAQPHDSLFFHCEYCIYIYTNDIRPLMAPRCLDSGHGGQVKDTNGDEVDGYDEGQHIFLLMIPVADI